MATLIWPFARESVRAAHRVQLAPTVHLHFHDIDLHDNHDYGLHRVSHPGSETVVERNRPSRLVGLPTFHAKQADVLARSKRCSSPTRGFGPGSPKRLSVVLSTKWELERETGLEPATFSLEG